MSDPLRPSKSSRPTRPVKHGPPGPRRPPAPSSARSASQPGESRWAIQVARATNAPCEHCPLARLASAPTTAPRVWRERLRRTEEFLQYSEVLLIKIVIWSSTLYACYKLIISH